MHESKKATLARIAAIKGGKSHPKENGEGVTETEPSASQIQSTVNTEELDSLVTSFEQVSDKIKSEKLGEGNFMLNLLQIKIGNFHSVKCNR